MVLAEGLAKTFTDRKTKKVAVDDVSFQARPGEVFGLLGINGAGKTTTLRMLSTVILPTNGKASVAGFDVVQRPADVRASIGFLSSSTALYGRLTGRETLEYFGKLYGIGAVERKARIDRAIARLQLEEFIDRTCDKLSTGQKQRVSIARATLHDPPILFFDEPTAGLDVVAAQTVMEFIEACRTEGKTLIFSTHIMPEVERLCDRVAVIHDGTIKDIGTVPELMSRAGETTFEKTFLKLVDYKPEAALV